LEVGCGEGSNLLYLRERLPGVQLFGADFAEAKVKLVHTADATCGAVCADATRLPFAGAQFDVVLYRDLLHHVHWARDEVVREGLRVVKPGGVLVVVEPNGRRLLNRVFRWLYAAERGSADTTPEQLLALGQRHGQARIEYIEATLLVRAVGFVLGWPPDRRQALLRPLYALASIWEKLIEAVIPRRRWAYLMMLVEAA